VRFTISFCLIADTVHLTSVCIIIVVVVFSIIIIIIIIKALNLLRPKSEKVTAESWQKLQNSQFK